MFTGIIKGVGRVADLQQVDGDVRITLDTQDAELGPLSLGDSVAVNGVCLTVVDLTDTGFSADVSRETLSLTSLGQCERGAHVNLEPALRAGDPLGGHLVSGHVDAMTQLIASVDDARSQRMRFAMPSALAGFIAVKGSITLDGISLTVNAVDHDAFEVNIVPHTLSATNLGERAVGDNINLEVDTLARYVHRLLEQSEH